MEAFNLFLLVDFWLQVDVNLITLLKAFFFFPWWKKKQKNQALYSTPWKLEVPPLKDLPTRQFSWSWIEGVVPGSNSKSFLTLRSFIFYGLWINGGFVLRTNKSKSNKLTTKMCFVGISAIEQISISYCHKKFFLPDTSD